jgi:hypothetical protein
MRKGFFEHSCNIFLEVVETTRCVFIVPIAANLF